MKLTCSKDILMEGINVVLKAVSGRSTLPILDCILIIAEEDGYKLIGNDLEIGIETRLIEARVDEPGSIALDAKVFADIVRRLPGNDVRIECMNNYITLIKGGVAEFKILGNPGDEFTLLPEIEADGGFEIFSGELRNMIRQTIFSVSADESRPAMTGELFTAEDGVLRVASVDGFRISVRYADIDNKELNASVIVPGKTLGEIVKILDTSDKSITSVFFAEKHILFETDNARVVSRLIEGKFLDFESVFNTEGTTFITLNTKDVSGCIDRAMLISRGNSSNPVKFTIDRDNERLLVESNTETGTFYEELPAEVDGLDLKIAINPKFLTDIYKVIGEERVRMQFTTPLSPCIIKGVDADDSNVLHKYLILPVRDMR